MINPVAQFRWWKCILLISYSLFQVVRYKPVPKPIKGKRKCKCRKVTKTRDVGFGQFQMYQDEKCDSCKAVKLVNCCVLCFFYLISQFPYILSCLGNWAIPLFLQIYLRSTMRDFCVLLYQILHSTYCVTVQLFYYPYCFVSMFCYLIISNADWWLDFYYWIQWLVKQTFCFCHVDFF